jgi:hypothetical protein
MAGICGVAVAVAEDIATFTRLNMLLYKDLKKSTFSGTDFVYS